MKQNYIKEIKPLYEKFPTPYDYIKRQIVANKGTQNSIMKDKLIELAKKNGVLVEKSDTKEMIFVNLVEKMPLEDIVAECNIGIGSFAFQQKFGITGADVKKMAEKGFIKVTGKEYFRAYGQSLYANLYSVFDYYRLTSDEVHKWLQANTRKKKR